jgi:hypothetical protein
MAGQTLAPSEVTVSAPASGLGGGLQEHVLQPLLSGTLPYWQSMAQVGGQMKASLFTPASAFGGGLQEQVWQPLLSRT